LLELARYVVLNPVRARMVGDAAEWPLSSYCCMTGQAPTPLWLQTDALLGRFGLKRDQAEMRFIDFVHAGVDQPPLWDKLREQIYLGGDAFH
jgi:putative transposase